MLFFCVLVVFTNPLTFTLFFSIPSGLGPSLPSWLGGFHHQPVQCHTDTCDIITTTFTVSKEEATTQRCTSRPQIEFWLNNRDCFLIITFFESELLESVTSSLAWRLQWHFNGHLIICLCPTLDLRDSNYLYELLSLNYSQLHVLPLIVMVEKSTVLLSKPELLILHWSPGHWLLLWSNIFMRLSSTNCGFSRRLNVSALDTQSTTKSSENQLIPSSFNSYTMKPVVLKCELKEENLFYSSNDWTFLYSKNCILVSMVFNCTNRWNESTEGFISKMVKVTSSYRCHVCVDYTPPAWVTKSIWEKSVGHIWLSLYIFLNSFIYLFSHVSMFVCTLRILLIFIAVSVPMKVVFPEGTKFLREKGNIYRFDC